MCIGIQELMDSLFLLVIEFFIFFPLLLLFYVPGNWQLQWISHVMRIGLELNVIYRKLLHYIHVVCVLFFSNHAKTFIVYMYSTQL